MSIDKRGIKDFGGKGIFFFFKFSLFEYFAFHGIDAFSPQHIVSLLHIIHNAFWICHHIWFFNASKCGPSEQYSQMKRSLFTGRIFMENFEHHNFCHDASLPSNSL